MVISVRIPDGQAERVKAFAEQRGMSVSDFVRLTISDYISEAEAELRRADEQRALQERRDRLRRLTDEFAGFLADTPLACASDAEIKRMMQERYA